MDNIIEAKELQIERKHFHVEFRENDRGKFLRITEEAHGRRNTIIVPSTGVDEFTAAIGEVLAGAEIRLKFRDPLTDSRTPDILVQPTYGTIYTGSSKKNAEHGGFSFGDTNVGLMVSNPSLNAREVKTPVATSQVAASILKALGIDPRELQAVRSEGTEVLPFLFSDGAW